MNIIPPRSVADEGKLRFEDYTPSSSARPLSWFGVPQNLTRHINETKFPRGGTPYGLSGLRDEAMRVINAREGARNNTLWSVGCKVGQLIGGGELALARGAADLLEVAVAVGLSEEEAEQVLLRPQGAFLLGISEPRNRNGFLVEQYFARTLNPKQFDSALMYLGPYELWREALNRDNPGWTAQELQWNIEELDVIYWANYCYFLDRINSLVGLGVRGTFEVYEILNQHYLQQASEWERLYVDINHGLSAVIANNPVLAVTRFGQIFDARNLVAGTE